MADEERKKGFLLEVLDAVGTLLVFVCKQSVLLDRKPASPKKLHVAVALILILIHDHMYFLDGINYVFLELMNASH